LERLSYSALTTPDSSFAHVADYFATHRKTRWVGLGLGALVLLIVLFLAFFDWNYFKPTLARMISEKTGRPTTIAGNLGFTSGPGTRAPRSTG